MSEPIHKFIRSWDALDWKYNHMPLVLCPGTNTELTIDQTIKLLNDQAEQIYGMDNLLVEKDSVIARLRNQLSEMQAELIDIYGLDQPFNDEDAESEDAEDMSWIN